MHDLEIRNGEVIFPSRELSRQCTIIVQDGKIREIKPPKSNRSLDRNEKRTIIDASSHYVAPGFIDLQVNGGAGADFLNTTSKGIQRFSSHWLSTGCTGYLATVITEDISNMRSTVEKILTSETENLVGIHIEGPFISMEKRGTHDPNYVRKPDSSSLNKLINGYEEHVKLFTLAPELPGAHEIMHELQDLNITPSIGHSAGTFEQANQGLHAGAKSFTHLYNAMTGLHHRHPGCVGAALTSDAYAGLICDGLHVHPSAIKIASQMKGPNRLFLVTDAISAAGLSEGFYKLGNQKINVKEGIARLDNGSIAGSTLTMDRAVKNYMFFAGVSLPEAIRSATLTPAKLIGIDDQKGSIEIGKDADFVFLDDDLEVQKTIIKGEMVFNKEDKSPQ